MPVTFTLSPNGSFTLNSLTDIVDFIAIDAGLTGFSANGFSGSGTFMGELATFEAAGSGFGLGTLGGDPYITQGVLDALVFTVGQDVAVWTDMNFQMSLFSQAIYEEEQGIDASALENFLLGQDWILNLSNGADIMPAGSTVGDGVPFNPVGDDVFNGLGGDDDLFAGDGNDQMFGGLGHDTLNGGNGRDLLNGALGNDILIGGTGHDRLLGGNGSDDLRGMSGRDLLIGGRDNDVLTGGFGSDRFMFRNNDGDDTITDFDATDDREVIILRFVSGITDFADLSDPANGHMVQDGANVVIDDGAGWSVTLENVDLADLDANDFIF